MDGPGQMSVADASLTGMVFMDSRQLPFLRPVSLNPFDIVADGVVEALFVQGVNELSISSVAKALGMTPQGLHQRLRRHRHDEGETALAALCRMTSVALSQRWLAWVRESLMVLEPDVPALRLPQTEHEWQGVAAWEAWHLVARGRVLAGDPTPSEILASAHDEERGLVGDAFRRALGRPAPDHHLVALLALANGLRSQLVRPKPTLSLGVAQEVMARQVAAVLNEETRPAA